MQIDEYYSDKLTVDWLEALTILWDVRIRSTPTPGTLLAVTLAIHDHDTGQELASFVGTLREAITKADAWSDGVTFTFEQDEMAQEVAHG